LWNSSDLVGLLKPKRGEKERHDSEISPECLEYYEQLANANLQKGILGNLAEKASFADLQCEFTLYL